MQKIFPEITHFTQTKEKRGGGVLYLTKHHAMKPYWGVEV
jgi:hypothetical protein